MCARAWDPEDERGEREQNCETPHLTTLPPPSSQKLGSDVDDGYGSDLMGDADDRAHLATLTELERESVLFDRAEARDNELKRRRALRLAKGFAPPRHRLRRTRARPLPPPGAPTPPSGTGWPPWPPRARERRPRTIRRAAAATRG